MSENKEAAARAGDETGRSSSGPKSSNKRRAFRMKHADDFRVGENGKVEYSGTYRVYRVPGEDDAAAAAGFRREMVILIVLIAAAAVSEFTAGMFPYLTTRSQFHVMLPYAAGVILTAVTAWKLGRAAKTKGKMRRYVYEETLKVLPALSLAGAVMCLIRLAAIGIDAVSGVMKISSGTFAGIIAATVAAGWSLSAFSRRSRAVRDSFRTE